MFRDTNLPAIPYMRVLVQFAQAHNIRYDCRYSTITRLHEMYCEAAKYLN